MMPEVMEYSSSTSILFIRIFRVGRNASSILRSNCVPTSVSINCEDQVPLRSQAKVPTRPSPYFQLVYTGVYLAERMTAEDTRLIWYNNNALTLINEGGKMVTQFANLFLYAAIVLALFSIFMLYNYISASIVAKKRSIGVLRALGSGCKDIVSMFITESLIIAIVNGILASFVAAAGCVLVNMYIRNIMNLAIDFALYDVRQVVIIIITSILTAVASSIIPIIKISKEKPVNLIREL